MKDATRRPSAAKSPQKSPTTAETQKPSVTSANPPPKQSVAPQMPTRREAPAVQPTTPPLTLAGWLRAKVPTWTLLPLRLFLAITFIYAGIQKLTDPQYFRPSAAGYIGRQIIGFASKSPIRGLLLNVALPHATLFGGLIAYGELAIGLGVLVGLLVRPAAFFGALLSLIFFLSASWRVTPYFYGSDIVFLFNWSVLLLAGPAAGGWPVFDARLASWLLARVPEGRRASIAQALWFILGVRETAAEGEPDQGSAARQHQQTTRVTGQVRGGRNLANTAYARAQSRRDFFRGAAVGVAGALGLVFIISLLRGGDSAASGNNLPQNSTGGGTSGATGTTGAGSTIAQVSQVPTNNATTFTLSNSDPGVLVHLPNGNFVAFDAVCTHAGCTVQYDPSSQMLLCPCHGAAFDPAHNASVVQGPAPTPLTSVPIQVNQATGAITVSS